jgi:hypothetical protein
MPTHLRRAERHQDRPRRVEVTLEQLAEKPLVPDLQVRVRVRVRVSVCAYVRVPFATR